MKFQAACSAAGLELRDYTQWVHWRAPTRKVKGKIENTNPDGCPRGEEFVGDLPQRRGLALEPGPDVLCGHVYHGRPSA